MPDNDSSVFDVAYAPLVTRLKLFAAVDPEDLTKLETLPFAQLSFDRGQSIVRREEEFQDVMLLVSGWAGRARFTADGLRQIVHILLPGDVLTGEALVLRHSDHEVISLTRTVLRLVKRDDLWALFRQAPSLAAALWWVAEQEDAMLREHIFRLGRRTALERTGHLLLELHRRLLMVRQATEDALIFPITQQEIGDLLGLSTVHVYRTLRKLEAAGLIDRRKTVIRLCDRDGLAKLCDFDLTHFHLDAGERGAAAGRM